MGIFRMVIFGYLFQFERIIKRNIKAKTHIKAN